MELEIDDLNNNTERRELKSRELEETRSSSSVYSESPIQGTVCATHHVKSKKNKIIYPSPKRQLLLGHFILVGLFRRVFREISQAGILENI